MITELGLSHVSDSKVGGAEDRGVSGGERRRVSIGVQLLLDPSKFVLKRTFNLEFVKFNFRTCSIFKMLKYSIS